MSRHPVSGEVVATLGAFATGGFGRYHSALTTVFVSTHSVPNAPSTLRKVISEVSR